MFSSLTRNQNKKFWEREAFLEKPNTYWKKLGRVKNISSSKKDRPIKLKCSNIDHVCAENFVVHTAHSTTKF